VLFLKFYVIIIGFILIKELVVCLFVEFLILICFFGSFAYITFSF